MESFEDEDQDLELHSLCDEEPVESGEDWGDRITEPGAGEDTGCRVLDDLQPIEGGVGEANMHGVCIVKSGCYECVYGGLGSLRCEIVAEPVDVTVVVKGRAGHGTDAQLIWSTVFCRNLSFGTVSNFNDIFHRESNWCALNLIGEGPFPGVVDLYGSIGGLVDCRASLLASHGFTTMALASFGFDNLPKDTTKLNLEYFEEAVNFLRQYPKVKGPGVGAIVISKGGDLVLSMATFIPHVAPVVTIGGYKMILSGLNYNAEQTRVIDAGLLDVSDALNDPMDEANKHIIIPIEKAEGKFLFVAWTSVSDKNWNTKRYAEEAVKRLREHGEDNYEVLSYPGVGHCLESPFFPFCFSSYHFVVKANILWGGHAKPHSFAQKDLWSKMQQFLQKVLNHQITAKSKL
uniref:BAAT/Acyl-CoA thioester hydrolase C-terminal domain-containing protein n=1 Tax=Callorhinchus milii TaxID=7868 RepID=A0A4W3I186_CALMI